MTMVHFIVKNLPFMASSQAHLLKEYRMSSANNYRISKYSFLTGFIKNIIFIVLCCMWLSLTACGGTKDEEAASSKQEPKAKTETLVKEAASNEVVTEIQANKEKWVSHAITGYQIEMQKLCFCSPDAVRLMIFEVENDEIKTVRYADSGDEVDPSLYNQYSTVEGLFALVEQALEKNPADLSIAYDEEYGYIKELTIDYKKDIADDEVTIIASNIKPH